MHPLVSTLSEFKDSELETKIQDLTRKYWIAKNVGVRDQIKMVLDVYTNELQLRREKVWQKQHEDMNNSLGKLIKVN